MRFGPKLVWPNCGLAFGWTDIARLKAVAKTKASVRLVGPLDGGGGGVAGQHVLAAPAGEHQQVPLLSSSGQPPVGEGVPEAVRVDVGDAGLCGAEVQHVAGAVGRHRAALAEQQPRRTGVGVQGPDP